MRTLKNIRMCAELHNRISDTVNLEEMQDCRCFSDRANYLVKSGYRSTQKLSESEIRSEILNATESLRAITMPDKYIEAVKAHEKKFGLKSFTAAYIDLLERGLKELYTPAGSQEKSLNSMQDNEEILRLLGEVSSRIARRGRATCSS